MTKVRERGRGRGGSQARSRRKAGIVAELRRRLDYLRRGQNVEPGEDCPAQDARRHEADALERAVAILEAETMPESPSFVPNPTAGTLDVWRQVASWDAARQVRVLMETVAHVRDRMIAALRDPLTPPDTSEVDAIVTLAFHEAQRAERSRPQASTDPLRP